VRLWWRGEVDAVVRHSSAFQPPRSLALRPLALRCAIAAAVRSPMAVRSHWEMLATTFRNSSPAAPPVSTLSSRTRTPRGRAGRRPSARRGRGHCGSAGRAWSPGARPSPGGAWAARRGADAALVCSCPWRCGPPRVRRPRDSTPWPRQYACRRCSWGVEADALASLVLGAQPHVPHHIHRRCLLSRYSRISRSTRRVTGTPSSMAFHSCLSRCSVERAVSRAGFRGCLGMRPWWQSDSRTARGWRRRGQPGTLAGAASQPEAQEGAYLRPTHTWVSPGGQGSSKRTRRRAGRPRRRAAAGGDPTRGGTRKITRGQRGVASHSADASSTRTAQPARQRVTTAA
jgi:hypothetical protein